MEKGSNRMTEPFFKNRASLKRNGLTIVCVTMMVPGNRVTSKSFFVEPSLSSGDASRRGGLHRGLS